MKKEDGFQERSDQKRQTSEQTNWEDYEDEDVFDRIPLEQEIEPDALMEELRQERQAQQEVEKTENQPKQERGLGIASMVLGIFSILCFCIPVLGLVLAIAALVLGIVATAKKNGKKMGISGIVMGSIGLVCSILGNRKRKPLPIGHGERIRTAVCYICTRTEPLLMLQKKVFFRIISIAAITTFCLMRIWDFPLSTWRFNMI